MKKERGTHRGWPIDGENCDRQSARALSPRDEREVTYIRAFHRGRFSETAHFSFQPVRPTWLLPFSSRFQMNQNLTDYRTMLISRKKHGRKGLEIVLLCTYREIQKYVSIFTYLRMWIISFSFFWVHYSKINKVLCISSNTYNLKSNFCVRFFVR